MLARFMNRQLAASHQSMPTDTLTDEQAKDQLVWTCETSGLNNQAMHKKPCLSKVWRVTGSILRNMNLIPNSPISLHALVDNLTPTQNKLMCFLLIFVPYIVTVRRDVYSWSISIRRKFKILLGVKYSPLHYPCVR